MSDLITTRYAVRIMGVWVRRADALLQDGAVANALRAARENQPVVAERVVVPAPRLPVDG